MARIWPGRSSIAAMLGGSCDGGRFVTVTVNVIGAPGGVTDEVAMPMSLTPLTAGLISGCGVPVGVSTVRAWLLAAVGSTSLTPTVALAPALKLALPTSVSP